jgi:hypothetical protein
VSDDPCTLCKHPRSVHTGKRTPYDRKCTVENCICGRYYLEPVLTGREVDLDGHVDANGIRYIGNAYETTAGMWNCLAEVSGNLCRVEVKIKEWPTEEEPA